MAADDNHIPARYETLHELITRSAQLGLHVALSVHNCPTATALEWVQLGLLDGIGPGAGSNPPTGEMDSGTYRDGDGMATATVFTDGPTLTLEEREAAVARVAEELAMNTALLEELRRSEEEAV